MGEWTKEPWELQKNRDGVFSGTMTLIVGCNGEICGPRQLGRFEDENVEANMNRTVECVNAMQGIPDPAKFVEAFAVMNEIGLIFASFELN